VIGWDIKYKVNNKLDALSQRMVFPLQVVAGVLSQRIKLRVLEGKDPTGRAWSPLGRVRMGEGRGRLHDDDKGTERALYWWVPPTEPQPNGYVFRVADSAKNMAGFAVYRDYNEYISLSPKGNRRDWYKTGKFWESMAVRPLSPMRVKVGAYGSRKIGKHTVKNRDIGYYAGKREQYGVFTVSDAEHNEALAYVKASVDEQMARRIGFAEGFQQVNQRLAGLQKRASKVLGG
jgi:hypothetical protein